VDRVGDVLAQIAEASELEAVDDSLRDLVVLPET